MRAMLTSERERITQSRLLRCSRYVSRKLVVHFSDRSDTGLPALRWEILADDEDDEPFLPLPNIWSNWSAGAAGIKIASIVIINIALRIRASVS
jgi:hypothetical protein